MKVIKLNIKDESFYIPLESGHIPFMMYQRYGYYYIDMEASELLPNNNIASRRKYNLNLNRNEKMSIEILDIGHVNELFSEIDSDFNSFQQQLTDQDHDQMIKRFYTLDHCCPIKV